MKIILLLFFSRACCAAADTLLDSEFCQTYYDGADPSKCLALAAMVTANHDRTLPTLELGNTSTASLLLLPLSFLLAAFPPLSWS